MKYLHVVESNIYGRVETTASATIGEEEATASTKAEQSVITTKRYDGDNAEHMKQLLQKHREAEFGQAKPHISDEQALAIVFGEKDVNELSEEEQKFYDVMQTCEKIKEEMATVPVSAKERITVNVNEPISAKDWLEENGKLVHVEYETGERHEIDVVKRETLA